MGTRLFKAQHQIDLPASTKTVRHQQNGHCGPKQINYGATRTASYINPLKDGITRLPNGKYSIDIYPSTLLITKVKSGTHGNRNHASEGKKQYLVC